MVFCCTLIFKWPCFSLYLYHLIVNRCCKDLKKKKNELELWSLRQFSLFINMCIVINVLFLGVLCISEHVQYLNIKVYKILKIQQIIDVLTKPSKWKMPTFQKKIKTEYFLFQKRCQPNKDTNNLLKCTLLM